MLEKKGNVEIKALLKMFKENKIAVENCTYFQAQHKYCSSI